jgi:hypothetical protein
MVSPVPRGALLHRRVSQQADLRGLQALGFEELLKPLSPLVEGPSGTHPGAQYQWAAPHWLHDSPTLLTPFRGKEVGLVLVSPPPHTPPPPTLGTRSQPGPPFSFWFF